MADEEDAYSEPSADSESLSEAIVSTIVDADLPALAGEYLEAGIDALLSEGVLRDIPFIGTVVAVGKATVTIRDRLFVRKLLQFLGGLNSVPAEARREMIEKLRNDPDYARNLGEHLIELLDRLDGHRKPEMVAKVFEAYIAEEIDGRTLNRLLMAIERLPWFEIDSVRTIHEQSQQGDGVLEATDATFQALEGAGLMMAVSAFGGMNYRVTDLCETFVRLELDTVGLMKAKQDGNGA